MAVSKTLSTETGQVTITVEDRTRWREEALASVCEEVLTQILRRLHKKTGLPTANPPEAGTP